MKKALFFIITAFAVAHYGCSNAKNDAQLSQSASEGKVVLASFDANQFNTYWFAGKAELNSYDYVINRYEQERKGKAVMVFVTEDFSKSKQVKLDYPDKAGDDRVPVLKLNALQKFTTGVYDYALMTSIFTPIDVQKMPHSLKWNTTVQDWCGHVFTQLNWQNGQYAVHQYSYFEMEGDKSFNTEGALLEDEVFTRLRINPESLPKGQTKVIPNLTFSRLRHKDIEALDATIAIQSDKNGLKTCRISYPKYSRDVTIWFEEKFPHRIQQWEETQNGKMLSKATLSKTIMSDYWTRNSHEFDYMREELGL